MCFSSTKVPETDPVTPPPPAPTPTATALKSSADDASKSLLVKRAGRKSLLIPRESSGVASPDAQAGLSV